MATSKAKTTEPAKVPEAHTGWEVIRARNNDGGTYTTTRALAAQAVHEVLEGRPAVDEYGNWLPPKPKENLTTKGAK